MSTAAAFKYPKAFPFCVADISGSSYLPQHSNYVANLTLADVMAFAWNLETFTITTLGTATKDGKTADGSMYFTLSAPASDYLTRGKFTNYSMLFGASMAFTNFASWPAIRKPRERVCYGTPVVIASTLLDLNCDDSPTFVRQNEIGFWVGTDPSNSGKYRLYYTIQVIGVDPLVNDVSIEWTSSSSAPTGMSSITSGTITIGGITLNWYSYKTTGATHTDGTMTATTTSFTY